MAKKNEYNKLKIRKRCAIQLFCKKYPKYSNTQVGIILGVSPMTISRWKGKDYFFDKKRKRKSLMTRMIKNFLIKRCKNKFTGINKASSRRLAKEIRRCFNLSVSHATINSWLKKIFKAPIKATKTFLLRNKDKKRRIDFAQMLLEKKISGRNIFFTDEKRFILNPPLNRQTNQIRLDEKGLFEYKNGKGELYERIAKPLPKFQKGFMVAAGLSYKGVGKLIFITGTQTSFSYLQTLEYFKEDIERIDNNLFFQQDNATCHVGKSSMNYIKTNFKNSLEFWPPNSPDLSPIEELWAIVEEQLSKYTFNSIEEMSKKLQYIWNRIPKLICRHLIDSFDKKIQLIKDNGERANKRYHLEKRKSDFSWKNRWNDNDCIERIVYNQKILINMKMQKIKILKSQLKNIKDALIEEKKRYSIKNKQKIKKESFELYQFFLSEEKRMNELYDSKIRKKEEEIKEITNLEGKNLFDIFSLEEKINNVRLNRKGLSTLSTNINSNKLNKI